MEDGITGIVAGLRDFGVEFDEGMMSQTEEKGDYGPYQQSRRGPLYQAFCKELVKRGLAYPCFCTEEDLGRHPQAAGGGKGPARLSYHLCPLP